MAGILVTGGNGFIGSNLVRKLADSGKTVRVIDNLFRGRPDNLEGLEGKVELIKGDILDKDIVSRSLKGIDTVYHFGAINGTKFFYEIPEEVLRVNVGGLMNVLDCSVKAGVQRFIFSSSSEVYNAPEIVPTPEVQKVYIPDIKNPRFSYSGSKIIGELFCVHYGNKFNIDTVIVRYHNIYGPRMGFEHVVPEIALRIKELSKNLSLQIIDLPIQGTGKETRAFCFIDDAVEATVLCAEKGKKGEIYNIGNDEREISINELAGLMGKVLGVNISIVPQIDKKRIGGTDRRCPDIKKIRGLGYKPRVSLEEGLKKTISAYLSL